MTVLVTGRPASRLAPGERLLADGHDVVGLDCLTDYYDVSRKRGNLAPLLANRHFRLEQLDLAMDDLGAVVAEATHVYHLAGQPGVRGSWGEAFGVYVRNNITATQRLLEAMRGSAARLVFASSSSVYGDAERYPTPEDAVPQPISPYGVTKLCSEQLVMAYRRSVGLDARCVRYFTVYGPRQRPDMAFSRFIAAAVRGDAIEVYGDGSQVRDFTFVADAVEATVRAASVEDPGEGIFNVGGGSQVTVRHVLEVLGGIVGTSIRVRTGPPQPGDVRATGADLRRAELVLGWRPSVSLADGLRAQVDAAGRGSPECPAGPPGTGEGWA
jgi:nucleoside-diphosphate-sugar epimerase